MKPFKNANNNVMYSKLKRKSRWRFPIRRSKWTSRKCSTRRRTSAVATSRSRRWGRSPPSSSTRRCRRRLRYRLQSFLKLLLVRYRHQRFPKLPPTLITKCDWLSCFSLLGLLNKRLRFLFCCCFFPCINACLKSK